jgi:hypothetical protein
MDVVFKGHYSARLSVIASLIKVAVSFLAAYFGFNSAAIG